MVWATVGAWAVESADGLVKEWVSGQTKGLIRRLFGRKTAPERIGDRLRACVAAGLEGFVGVLGDPKDGELESLRELLLGAEARRILGPLERFEPREVDGRAFRRVLCSSPAAPEGVDADDPILEQAWGAFVRCFEDELAAQDGGALQRVVDSRRAAPRPTADADFDDFVRAQRDDSAFIEIQGISSAPGRTKDAGRYPIHELYTPLRVRDGRRGTLQDRGARALARALTETRRLLIEGEPGAGKTTFLRLVTNVLCRDWLREAAPDRATSWRAALLDMDGRGKGPLPIYLRLGDLAPMWKERDGRGQVIEHERWVIDLLAQLAEKNGWGIARAAWGDVLGSGDAVLLFDGLDEVAESDLRERVFDVFRASLDAWPRCRVVVATRPIDTGPVEQLGFEKATVEELSTGDIRGFLRRWVAGLWGQDPERMNRASSAYRDKLEGAICTRPEIRRLAHNPVMLTCLCVIHWNERSELPEGRSRVYAAVLRWLLSAREQARKDAGFTTLMATQALQDLAYALMGPDGAKRSAMDLVEAARLVAPRVGRACGIKERDGQEREAERWLELECLVSGVVVKTGIQKVRFWHLTFQEFLAARRLAELGGADVGEACWWPVVSRRLHDSLWRETVELFPGCLLDKGEGQVDALLERVLALRGEAPDLAMEARVAGALGRLLRPLRVLEYRPKAELEAVYRSALERAEAIFTVEGARAVPLRDRVAVAEALGQGGDRRFGGSSPTANLDRVPGMDVALGRYPVTVREYEDFVRSDGYLRERWWWEWWAIREKEGWTEPDEWERQLEHPTRPVTGVSWYEAEAYCAWRAELAGMAFRLPTEDEWEAAARHPDGPYPWGGTDREEPDPGQHGNYERSDIDAPTPVGLFPTGVGRGGHLDLAGNVLEWCAEVEATDEREWDERERSQVRALRGGGFWDDAVGLRSAVRNGSRAGRRRDDVGFRVALSPASRWLR